MNLKDKLIVKVDNLDHYGRGIARTDDKVIFVNNALISEVVEIEVTSVKKRIVEARVLNYIETSNNRIKPICPYYGICGGCSLMHISYGEQLKYKENKVKEIIKKFAQLDDYLVKNIIRAEDPLFYRNKVTFQCDNGVGFYQNKSNKIVKIDKCYIIDQRINDIIPKLNKIKDVDKIVVKASKNTDGLLVDVLDQDKYIYESLDSYTFRISNDGFFQVNTEQTVKLYDKVKEYLDIKDTDNLLDLYCGAGTIGIYNGGNANKVLGIEINKSAIDNAYLNKDLNKVTNIDFKLGDVSKLISEIEFMPTKIIVDPPRAGLDSKTIEYLNSTNASAIVYVSCDPVTLARDLKLLDKYEVKEITPLDMFPNTYHVECVSLLVCKTFENN